MAPDDITAWIASSQNGDEEAAARIWDKYFHDLVSYARRKLSAMPRRAADEEDVVLSAMNSFFLGARNGNFHPADRDELWRLLATITVRKATAGLRKHYAQKRGSGAVRGESVFGGFPDANSEFGINAVLDDRQLPEMSLKLATTCDEMLQRLGEESLRKVAVLRLEGFSDAEIAEKLDCSVVTVKRKMVRIRDKWSALK